jgi:hypothetical protein
MSRPASAQATERTGTQAREDRDSLDARNEQRYDYAEHGSQRTTAAFVSERKYELAWEYAEWLGPAWPHAARDQVQRWEASRFGAMLAPLEHGVLMSAILHAAFPGDARFQALGPAPRRTVDPAGSVAQVKRAIREDGAALRGHEIAEPEHMGNRAKNTREQELREQAVEIV